MKKLIVLIIALVFCVSYTQLSYGADEKTSTAKTLPQSTAKMGPPPGFATPGGKPFPRPNFAIIFGKVTKIDKADPQKVMLEVKSEADNTVHNVELLPTATITKVTDISALNPGDTVRIMARKVDEKEIAFSVITGNIKNLPMRKPVMQGPPGTTTAPAKVTQQPPAK